MLNEIGPEALMQRLFLLIAGGTVVFVVACIIMMNIQL